MEDIQSLLKVDGHDNWTVHMSFVLWRTFTVYSGCHDNWTVHMTFVVHPKHSTWTFLWPSKVRSQDNVTTKTNVTITNSVKTNK